MFKKTLFANTNIGDYMQVSDLMIEAVNIKSEGLVTSVKRNKNIKVTTVTLTDNKYDTPGEYITIEFKDMFDNGIRKTVVKSLKSLFSKHKLTIDSAALVVGLGNEKSTPDSLGPLVIENIIVTRHLEALGLNSSRIVSAIKPGVMGETGIETKDIIKGVIEKIKPDFLIVIDSLKSESLKRLNKTIQITDTGIHPGSGVQNKREKLDKETLGIPVIAIGVPTVCDVHTIVKETTKRKNIKEIPNMIVTPKDIDFVVDKMSDLLSLSINNALYDFKL